MIDYDRLTLEDIRQRLKTQPPATYDVPPELLVNDSRQAAVLIPFLRIDDNWHILYIRRSTLAGDRHSGQVAFAGGKREGLDASLQSTALREAEEEVGIARQDVNILGRLNHHHTISEFEVTPFVGQINWPYPLTLDRAEVARSFTIPLNWLADRSNYSVETRQHPDSKRDWPIVYFEHYDGELLWGATARMTLSLIEVLNSSRPE